MQEEYPLLDIKVTILEIDELDECNLKKSCSFHQENPVKIAARETIHSQ